MKATLNNKGAVSTLNRSRPHGWGGGGMFVMYTIDMNNVDFKTLPPTRNLLQSSAYYKHYTMHKSASSVT
jgi:hypothetical protein